MKRNYFLLDAVGLIGDDLIIDAKNNALPKTERKSFLHSWGAIAACLLMIAAINIFFIIRYNIDLQTPSDDNPAAEDFTDASTAKYEIYVYNEEIEAEAMNNEPQYKLLNEFYPDAFSYGNFGSIPMLGYFVNEKMHYHSNVENHIFDYEKDCDIPHSKIVNTLKFAGETYDVEYRCGKTSGYVDEADATVYDTYAVYDYDGEEYDIEFYVRLDGEVIGAAADCEQTMTTFSVGEGKEMAQKYLCDILGDEADDYELYRYYENGLYHGIHFCNKIDGVLTNDVIYIELTGDGMLNKYTSEGRGRFLQYEDAISAEEVNTHVAYLKEKLDHLGIPTLESGTITEPAILEYSGELYIYLRLIPVKVEQDGECIGYLRQRTWFFIKIENQSQQKNRGGLSLRGFFI